MQTKSLSPAALEQQLEEASRRVDRSAHDMLEHLEDDSRERDYEGYLYALHAGEDRFARFAD